MVELDKIDLSALSEALEDHGLEHSWWFDPETGETVYRSEYELDDAEDAARRLIAIEPLESSEGYGDMEDFAAGVSDARARDLLARALQGRGAFRRFKDVLLEFPELRDQWFAFHDARMLRRALSWLRDEGLIDEETCEAQCLKFPDPAMPAPKIVDGVGVAAATAEALKELYGKRLRKVLLFGSWARRTAEPDSDVDLLVVLDRVDSSWEEHKRMSEVLDRQSFANDTVVTAIPVAEDDYRTASSPFLVRARAEGQALV